MPENAVRVSAKSAHESAGPGPFPPLFKNRNFLLLWAGYVISALGDRVHFVIILWLLIQLRGPHSSETQNTAQLNVMMLLPFLLLAPFTGALADRLPRRALMVTADFTRVVVVLVARTLFLNPSNALMQPVPWMPAINYAVLMLLGSELILGAFSAVFSPARNALMPNLVHPNQLLRANSMTNSAGTIASLIGFVVGGYLIDHMRNAAMYVDAGTFLCSGILLLCMTGKVISRRPRPAEEGAAGMPGAGKRRGFLADIADAVRYLMVHKRAVQITLLMFLFWCCGGIILSGLAGVVMGDPAHGGFGKSEAQFSYFLGYIGVGMIAGAASCSIARRGIPKEFGVAWAMTLVGVFFFLFSVPKGYALALTFLIFAAFFGAVMLVSLDTLLQRIVPDYIRGRVMALRDQLANVGLVGVAVPLAISNGLDQYIILILRVLAVVMTVVGLMLVAYYYRRQTLPLPVAIARRFVSLYLTVFKRFAVGNAGRIPSSGPVIFVANHTTAYDPLCLQVASRYRLIQFMMAKEFYEKKPMYYLYKWLGVIPVNRTGNDTASIRTALRALGDGNCIGMFPEGKISDDGRMNEGRQGVALLALMSGATVVPAYIQGTRAYQGMVKDFVSLDKVTLYFGAPIRFDDLPKGKRDEASREVATRRIMDAIIALRGRYETNPERRMSSAEYAAREGAGTGEKMLNSAG